MKPEFISAGQPTGAVQDQLDGIRKQIAPLIMDLSTTRTATGIRDEEMDRLFQSLGFIFDPSDPEGGDALEWSDLHAGKSPQSFWDDRVEPEQAEKYRAVIAKHLPTNDVPRNLRLEVIDVRGEVMRLHAKGAPFPISGKNDLLLVPRKWRLLYREYGAVGVEMKKGIRREQLKQAKMEFLLWASASNLPFCQCVTDLQCGGFALYQTAHRDGKHIVRVRLLKGMDSLWAFLDDLGRQLVTALPDDFPQSCDLPELPGPKRIKLEVPLNIVTEQPSTVTELIAAAYNTDVANLNDLACFDNAMYHQSEPLISASALSMYA